MVGGLKRSFRGYLRGAARVLGISSGGLRAHRTAAPRTTDGKATRDSYRTEKRGGYTGGRLASTVGPPAKVPSAAEGVASRSG